MLLRGATPWDVDETMVAFGYVVGPCAMEDLAGLDVDYARRREAAKTGARRISARDRMVEEGRIGRKGGVGFYRYPGGGGAVEDPLLEDLIADEAHFARIARREFSHDEIRRRLIAAMAAEANALIEEGVAASPGEIDRVSIERCGFPDARGGLMCHVEAIGYDATIADIRAFSADDPDIWLVTPGLRVGRDG